MLNALSDQSLLSDRLRFLMLNGSQEAVAEFRQGELALRPINLPLLTSETGQLSPGNIAIRGL